MTGASELLLQLDSELSANKLTDGERTKLLEQLKVIGRNPSLAKPIFHKTSIQTLCRYAFETGLTSASREAMRCLANAMFLHAPARQDFVDLGYASKAAERLKNDDRDDEFLASRILFFATYTKSFDAKTLVDAHGLAESIKQNLDRAVKRLDSSPDKNPITAMAVDETIKLTTNVALGAPEMAPAFYPALVPLTDLLIRLPLPARPLQPPASLLISALLSLHPPQSQLEEADLREPLFPTESPTSLTNCLTQILDLALSAPPSAADDATLAPLLTLLRNLHSTAPVEVQRSLQDTLLPPPSARSQALGSTSSLPDRLIRASADPSIPTSKDLAGALLFELSSSSGTQLVSNIGYGFAIGILTRLGIHFDPASLEGQEDVNPITGQRRDAELEAPLDDMTEEEKEREAERLFVLFERLKATGVVDVKNPVEMMRESQG